MDHESKTPISAGAGMVKDEAASYLRSMQFSESEGAHAAGSHVIVSIDKDWNDDGKAFSAVIRCTARGHRTMDWRYFPVFVYRTDDPDCMRIVNPNDQGNAILRDLRPGAYRIHASEVSGQVLGPIRRMAPAGRAEVQVMGEPVWLGPREYELLDGKLKATVTTDAGGTLVKFRTRERKFAGFWICFAFLDKDGRTEYVGRVQLSSDDSGPWQATSRPINLNSDCRLVFEIGPEPSEGDGDTAKE